MSNVIPWLIIALILAVVLFLASPILSPFIISLILAYFVMPLADSIEKKFKMNRIAVSLLLVTFITTLFVSIWIFLIPIIYDQVTYFVKSIPEYNAYINKQVVPLINEYLAKVDQEYAKKAPEIFGNLLSTFFKDLVRFIENIWRSGFVVVNLLLVIILIPLLTFYFIKDWHAISNSIEALIPMNKKNSYRQLVHDINKSLSAFIRGQFNVCIILATYYAVALSVIKLDYGVFIGITTGIVSFIPFLGLLGGFTASIIVAYFQFKSWYGILAVVIVFLVGNIIEGVLSPKLIGKKLGLHPGWIIFFVLLGGSVFGFVGMMLAIPLGAIIAVLIRFVLGKYYASKIYKKK